MLSNEWHREAIKRFPELRRRLEAADSPYQAWFELTDSFRQAYMGSRDEDMIKRIYDYCDWCLSQPAGKTAEDDLGTCVAVSFFEHIPEIPEALNDMPRWFTRTDILGMKDVLSYHVGPEGYAKVLACFDNYYKEQKRRKRKPRN